VRSDSTADLLRTKLETARAAAFAVSVRTELPELQVLNAANGRVIKQLDVIILGCKPYDFGTALQATDVQDALFNSAERKVLVTILGGVSTNQLWDCIQAGMTKQKEVNLQIVRVIPNIAARLGQSMTVIGLHDTKSSIERNSTHEELASLFSRIGAIEYLPEPLMDNGASLCTFSTAIFVELIGAVAQSKGARTIDETWRRTA
jgi:pyrroline-5-carboxylate reductase